MVENSNGTDDSSNNIINDAEQLTKGRKRKRPARPRLRWIDALRQGSSDMLLSPTYSPVPRVRTNGAELEGGGPARGIPETVAAMSPFAIQQNSSVDEVQIFLSTFEGGTSTLISPLKWNQSMNQNMKSTFYNYLRDYIYS